jgi:hypothetical protein
MATKDRIEEDDRFEIEKHSSEAESSRRDALSKFGRFIAVAPAMATLLRAQKAKAYGEEGGYGEVDE